MTSAMPGLTGSFAHEEQELKRRFSWLLGGRIVVATLLLGGTMLLAIEQEHGASAFTPRFLIGLIVATYAATLGSALWLRRATGLAGFATAQIACDLALATGLVYVAGGAASGFTFLYGATVLSAALVVGQRAAQLATLVALLLYITVGLALSHGVLPYPADQPSERYLLSHADVIFTMVANILGLLLVALLASHLAARLHAAGGRLREAAAQAAELVRLNEDIIRCMASGLLTTDTQRLVRSANPAALEIFRTERGRMLGRPLSEFFRSARDAGSSDAQRAETIGERPDGTTFPVGYTKTPLLNAAGEVTGELFLFQDLTEVTELRRAAERAERLAALGRLAAALAHEVRNPLGSISGSVQLVRESKHLEDEDRQLLGIVLREVDRLNGLVNTMLQVGRPSDPQRMRTDLVALTRDVVAVAKRDQRNPARIALVHDNREVVAFIDGDQIRQVIWNLLNNALNHAPAGSLVRIEIKQVDGRAYWTIEDEGPGIPLEARDQLFDMFYSKRPHGVGLGLALVDQIVRAHGGEIVVLSPPGQGATFQVRLPQRPAD